MKKLISCECDQNLKKVLSEKYHISRLCTCENVAVHVCEGLPAFLSSFLSLEKESRKSLTGSRILVLSGTGFNGLCGLAVARRLYAMGCNGVSVCSVTDETVNLDSDYAGLKQSVEAFGITLFGFSSESHSVSASRMLKSAVMEADIIIDCLLGTEFSGILTANQRFVIETVNTCLSLLPRPVLSIDMPSGISDDSDFGGPHINATKTIVLGLSKSCLYYKPNRSAAGLIEICNPDCPESLLCSIAETDVFLLEKSDLEVRNTSDFVHKGEKGRLAVFGGSKAYSGAPRLSALSATYNGCGYISLVCDPEIHAIVASMDPSFIVLSTDMTPIDSSKQDAILAGPGWGDDISGTRSSILRWILASHRPLVLDASALKPFSEILKSVEGSNSGICMKSDKHYTSRLECMTWNPESLILTPHAGEYASMGYSTGHTFKEFLRGHKGLFSAAAKTHATVVFKDPVTFICNGNECFVADLPNEKLAVAGSGDVLAGLCGSNLAFGMDATRAAVQAVLLHQEMGKNLKDRVGYFSSVELAMETPQR